VRLATAVVKRWSVGCSPSGLAKIAAPVKKPAINPHNIKPHHDDWRRDRERERVLTVVVPVLGRGAGFASSNATIVFASAKHGSENVGLEADMLDRRARDVPSMLEEHCTARPARASSNEHRRVRIAKSPGRASGPVATLGSTGVQ
jgi:hypothetical protein